MTKYLSGLVQYNPEKKAYECMYSDVFLSGHGNFEEQTTITGKDEYTENAFRYMFFDPLRWGHKTYELLVLENPGHLREFFVDPCGPQGVLNRVALMILRNELIYSAPILRDASYAEIEKGIRQIGGLLLSEDQKGARDLVYGLFRTKISLR